MPLYHLVRKSQWDATAFATHFRPTSLATEGFVHLSTDAQLLGSAEKWFADEAEILVVVVDEARLTSQVRYDPVGERVFPHLYGPLNLDAVVEVRTLTRGPDGRFGLPGWL